MISFLKKLIFYHWGCISRTLVLGGTYLPFSRKRVEKTHITQKCHKKKTKKFIGCIFYNITQELLRKKIKNKKNSDKKSKKKKFPKTKQNEIQSKKNFPKTPQNESGITKDVLRKKRKKTCYR